MIKQDINKAALIVSGMLVMTTTVHAGKPLWTYSAPSPSSVSVSNGETTTVTYTVTSETNKPKSLVLQTNPPAPYPPTPGLTASVCNLPSKGSACTLTITIDGSQVPAGGIHGGPYLCQADSKGGPDNNQCYQPSPGDTLVITRTTAPGTTTLSTSITPPSILALSVAGSGALIGNPRRITIRNIGINATTPLTVNYPGAWAVGAPTEPTPASDCGGAILAVGATCTITITPGSNSTSNCTSTHLAPTSETITVSASNVVTPVTTDVVVLGYGCQYQGGFLYSVEDMYANAPITGSIGGKVASTIDQAPPSILTGAQAGSMAWDADPACAISPYPCTLPTNAWDFYIGSDLASVIGSTNPGGTGTNGPGNTYQISSVLNGNNTDTNGPPANYAAGVCVSYTGENYTDWYLPAICEIGPDYNGFGCTQGTQNMVDNLSFLLGDWSATTPSASCSPPSTTDCLAGYYWSSTEYSGNPSVLAWAQFFASGGGSYQYDDFKGNALGVRCSRALTL